MWLVRRSRYINRRIIEAGEAQLIPPLMSVERIDAEYHVLIVAASALGDASYVPPLGDLGRCKLTFM